MATTCLSCGQVSENDDRFCAACGASLDFGGEPTGVIDLDLEDSDNRIAKPQAGSESANALLVVLRGALEGVRFPLEGQVGTTITLGRAADSGIFLDDVTVSRKHALVVRYAAGWTIVDQGSLNGTYVNRERVDERVLNNDDEVQVGKYRFAFLAQGN